MKTTDTHAFANQLLVCLLVTIGFGGSIGLGTVWMRHQISLTADANRRILAQIADVERMISRTTADADAERDPERLRQRNAEWRLGLVPCSSPEVHVLAVTENAQRALLERNNRDLYRDDAPASIKLPLAALSR
ncbi:MAG TPA: hypothetical protein VHD62_18800 [Opitutaceae bacterium]|nr:hypothetical protein [Opitutaceae bacterium]